MSLQSVGFALVLFALSAALPAAAATPKVVRIATVAYFDADKPLFVGRPSIIARQGWLASELSKRGIALQWVPASHTAVGPIINEAFANHSIDFAEYGDLPSIIVNAAGVATRVVVPSGIGLDTYLVVPAGSTAKTIDDLKGKRIAIHRGRPWEVPLLRLLESRGLSYADFKVYNMNPQAAAAALAAGSIDALYTLNDALILEDQHVGKIIWSTRNAPPDWKMRAELWAAKDFIDRYPDITQLVATAYVKAALWSSQSENKDALIKLYTRPGIAEDLTRREYDNGAVPWSERWSPLFDAAVFDHYRHVTDYAVAKKLIRKPLAPDALLEPRFVNAALAQLGLTDYWRPRPVQGAKP